MSIWRIGWRLAKYRPGLFAAREGRIDGSRACARLFGKERHYCIDGRIQPLDLRDMHVHDFCCRQFT